MDTELATHLMDLKEGMGKIDARTCAIQDGQNDIKLAFKDHVKQDHDDFATVHGRINSSDRKLNWVLGGVSLASFLIVAIIGIILS